MSGLQDFDHLECVSATAARLGALSNAIQELLAFLSQRLYPVQMIGHSLAIAVRKMELGFGIGIGWFVYPFIVNHQLVVRFDIIVDEHFLTAHHGIAAYLAGVKPAHPDVGQHAIGKIKAEIGNVVKSLTALHVDPAASTHRHRFHA